MRLVPVSESPNGKQTQSTSMDANRIQGLGDLKALEQAAPKHL
jgi:hypothetical protein